MADGSDIPGSHKSARHHGPVCVVARLEARDSAGVALEGMLRTLAAGVREAEADCTSYVVTREMGSGARFAVHARFANWAAFKAHAETPHLDAVLPRLTAELAAPLSLEIFLEV